MSKERINKSEFMERVAHKNDLEVKDVLKVWDAIESELYRQLILGKRVVFTRFGTFEIKSHKGHPVKLAHGPDVVDSYLVLSFKTSENLNKKIRNEGEDLLLELIEEDKYK